MFRKGVQLFLDQSLRRKLLSIWLVMIIILQFCSAFIFQGVLSKNYEEQITKSKLETLEQVSHNLNQNFYDIVERMIDIRDEVQMSQNLDICTQSDYFNNYTLYESYFNKLVASGNNYRLIDSMSILDGKETYYFSLEHPDSLNWDYLVAELEEKYMLEGSCIWIGSISDQHFHPAHEEKVVSIIMPVSRYREIKALVIINLSIKKLGDYLGELNTSEDYIMLKAGDTDYYISAETSEYYSVVEEVRNMIKKGKHKQIENSYNYLVMSDELDINQWDMYLVSDRQTINRSRALPITLFVVIFIAGLIAFVMGYFVVYSITRPLNKLTQIMTENGMNRELNKRFQTRYKDEIGTMASAYNHMMDKIQVLLENIEQEQLQNKKNYLKLLQLQIKPHFLYNSLEATRFLVEMKDPDAVEMISSIGRFYKLSLSGIKDIVELREEVEHLSCYLKILKIRYRSQYDYELNIPEEVQNNEIIKFSLQPLVENAIYHGVKNCRGKGLIRITAWVENDRIIVEIWDNGVGIPKERLEEIREEIRKGQGAEKSEHIGIVNVHQRIQMHYSRLYGIEIDSEKGVYTSVRILLPIQQYEGEEGYV